MTKRITSEDCEGNIEDIEDGRYNTHVVPVSAEDDPGYEDIDYGDCTEFTVPLGRYGSHVVPIGGTGGGGGAACPGGGLKAGTTIDGDDCLSVNLKPDGAIILDGGQLAIDTSKLKVTTDQVYPSGTDTGIVLSGPNGENWDTQADYNQWLYEDQKRQDEKLDQLDEELDNIGSPCYTVSGIPVTLIERDKIIIRDISPQPGYPLKTEVQLPEVQGAKPYPAETLIINGNEHEILETPFVVMGLVNYIIEGQHQSKYEGKHVDVTVCNPDTPYVTPPQLEAELENYVLKTGDTMTGDLKVEADVHANRIDSRIVDSGEQSNLQLQWNGATKVYVGKDEVTIQPPLQLNNEGTDPNHAVTKGYIDALDAKQAAEINTLEYKLDALLGLTFRGTYEFKHDQTCEEEYQECMANCIGGDARCEQDCLRDYSVCEGNTVNPGFFEAIDPDGQFDNLQEIIISKSDKSGVEVDWAGVLNAGDYLEVDHVFAGSLDKTNYGLYRITEEPVERTNSQGETVYDITLQFLQGDGVLNEAELYEIRGITAAEGVNPEELGDFLTKDEAAVTYATIGHTHNTQYAAKSHTHSGADITSGTVAIARLPTGTTSTTVAKGDHTHGYASSGHNHGTKYVKTGSSDSSPQDIRIYKSGSLWYIK